MDREEILAKITSIRRELEQDQFEIITEKILERKFHHHRSERGFLIKKIIEKIRKRLMLELELIMKPVLDNQKEINIRFLKEIDRLKKELEILQAQQKDLKHEKKTQENNQ